MLEGWRRGAVPTALPSLVLSVAVATAAAGDPRCQLPGPLTETLAMYSEGLADLPSAGERELTGLVVKCLGMMHEMFRLVCESLFALPAVVRLTQGGALQREGWPTALGAWAAGHQDRLQGWAVRHPECAAPRMQLRVAGAFIGDFGAQLGVLARQSAGDSGRGMAMHWLFRFQSAWSMALYYLTCLQYFSLPAFDPSNDLAYHLHRHRHAESPDDPGAAWWATVLPLPTFRLPRAEPLRVNEPSGTAVLGALRRRLGVGRLVRFAEIGVFQANLSRHVWRRAAFGRGSLEMHLVDHWGAAEGVGSGTSSVGTGSDMAGSSNSSLFRALVRRFSRTARSVQVPYGLPRGARRGAPGPTGDVHFHRTTSVGAAASFEDGSLDAVYVDADHKWWSVVQDLAAWWPKVRPGGVMMGHDFHLNSLMEREGSPGGDSNDVPLAVFAFFRAPIEIVLHSGFVWSVEKPLGPVDSSIDLGRLCTFLRERMAPHWDFEVCT